MNGPIRKLARCAIYTRKSTEYNLELAFNSLDAQREACEAYIKSQAHEGWRLILDHYDDGAFSGASLDRPALQKLLADVRSGKIDIIVVYKVDRLTRSLADFAKLVELFDQHSVSTQQLSEPRDGLRFTGQRLHMRGLIGIRCAGRRSSRPDAASIPPQDAQFWGALPLHGLGHQQPDQHKSH